MHGGAMCWETFTLGKSSEFSFQPLKREALQLPSGHAIWLTVPVGPWQASKCLQQAQRSLLSDWFSTDLQTYPPRKKLIFHEECVSQFLDILSQLAMFLILFQFFSTHSHSHPMRQPCATASGASWRFDLPRLLRRRPNSVERSSWDPHGASRVKRCWKRNPAEVFFGVCGDLELFHPGVEMNMIWAWYEQFLYWVFKKVSSFWWGCFEVDISYLLQDDWYGRFFLLMMNGEGGSEYENLCQCICCHMCLLYIHSP